MDKAEIFALAAVLIVVVGVPIGIYWYDSIYLPAQAPGEIRITARQWEFEPSTITVRKGDNVRLKLISEDVVHGFRIDNYGINGNLIPGKFTIIEFGAMNAGEFTIKCSVDCGAGHWRQLGRLIVEE